MKEEIISIPFVAHESSMNRMERTNKRLVIIAIIELAIILAMFISIMVYFYLPTDEIVTDTTTQEVQDVEGSEVNQNIGD